MTLLGVFYWFNYYRSNRGHYPKFKSIFNHAESHGGEVDLSFEFLLKNRLEFWTFCMLFWMASVLIIGFTFKQTDAFQATKYYCKTQQEILLKTGDIKYFGVLVGGSISNGKAIDNAEISFTIVGAKGNFNANSILFKESGNWTVKN